MAEALLDLLGTFKVVDLKDLVAKRSLSLGLSAVIGRHSAELSTDLPMAALCSTHTPASAASSRSASADGATSKSSMGRQPFDIAAVPIDGAPPRYRNEALTPSRAALPGQSSASPKAFSGVLVVPRTSWQSLAVGST